MDGLWKAAATALTVAVLMGLARGAGHRVAGLLAALPTTTAPALVWLAADQGPAFAARAAVASVAACAVLAAFAGAYAALAGRWRLGWTLAGALGVAALAVVPACWAASQLSRSLALALLSTAVVAWVWPGRPVAGLGVARPPAIWLTALAAGALGALAATLGGVMGSLGAGLIASLPVAGVAVAVAEHARRGPAGARAFLQAYLAGLVGKAGFGAVFALAVAPWGAGAACALASLVAVALTAGPLLARTLARALRGRRPPADLPTRAHGRDVF